MKLPRNVPVFGDLEFRGRCPAEKTEQIAFFNWIRAAYPKTYGALAVHIRNEGLKTYSQARWQRVEGLTKGAADIIIPAGVAFVCELKRRDHTKSAISDDQVIYLEAAKEAGAFACVALGYEAAKEAFSEWRKLHG